MAAVGGGRGRGRGKSKEGRDNSPAPGARNSPKPAVVNGKPSTTKSDGPAKPNPTNGEKTKKALRSAHPKPPKPAPKEDVPSDPPPAEFQAVHNPSRDLSMLRRPIEIGMAGVPMLVKCYQNGTDEVRDVLENECDIIFECKLCRSMFRGLPNLLAHKRVYCTDSFKDEKLPFVPRMSEPQTVMIQPQPAPETVVDVVGDTDSDSEVQVEIKPMRYPVAENIISPKRQSAFEFYSKVAESVAVKKESQVVSEIALKGIDGNANAVFQTVNQGTATVTPVYPAVTGAGGGRSRKQKQVEKIDLDARSDAGSTMEVDGQRVLVIRPESVGAEELANNISPEGSESSIEGTDGVKVSLVDRLRMRPDCDVDNIKCLKCKTSFSTLKSLARHMASLHSQKRMYYPCLFCVSVFTKTHSAIRHMINVHNISQDEVDQTRQKIKDASFIKQVEEFDIGEDMKSSPVRTWMMKKEPEVDPGTELRTTVSTDNILTEKRQKGSLNVANLLKTSPPSSPQKITPVAATNNPSTTGMSPTPGAQVSLKRFKCVCGKMFNTNWNCQQHITTCKKAKAKGMTSPSQGQLSMGVLTPKKSPTGSSPFKRLKCTKCNRILASSWHYAQHVKKCKAKGNVGKGKSVSDDVDKVEVKMPSQPTSPVKSEPASPMKVSPKGSPARAGSVKGASESSDDEVILSMRTRPPGSPRRLSPAGSPRRALGGGPQVHSDPGSDDAGSPTKLTDDELRRISEIVDEKDLRCMKCLRQYCSISYLHRHAVRHLGWRRYKCTLCKFTAYNRSECTTHLRKVHTAKTSGIRDMNPFIHDLEPEKQKQEQLSMLTRVERPGLERSNSGSEDYNISTRNSPRIFDTKPYVRDEESGSKSPAKKGSDSLTTLRTRGTAYQKPDLIKRKLENSVDGEGSTGEEDDGGQPREKRSRLSAGGVEQGKNGNGTQQSPIGGRRKAVRPQKSFNGSVSEEEKQNSSGRQAPITKRGSENDDKNGRKLALQITPTSPTKMSQKIENRVNSDVDKVLQMVQGSNKIQPTTNNNGDEVVILVVGENKPLSPITSSVPINTNSPIKISLSPKIMASPGKPLIAQAAINQAAIGGRGTPVVQLNRSPIKILPKPASPKPGGNIFDKLAANKLGVVSNNIPGLASPGAQVATGNGKASRKPVVK